MEDHNCDNCKDIRDCKGIDVDNEGKPIVPKWCTKRKEREAEIKKYFEK